MATASEAVKVFVSYAHVDDDYCKKLTDEWLVNLKRDRLIEVWTDHRLQAGDAWDPKIRQALQEAKLILLLVSQPFIASRYIYEVELADALARGRRGEAQVVPILIRVADWEGDLKDLQALPSDLRPVSKWADSDDAWFNITSGLKKVVNRIRGTPSDASDASKQAPVAVKTIPENVVKLCDRTRQEAAFSRFTDDMSKARPGAAQIYVLIEDDVDRPEFLVDRLYELRVPSLAVQSRGERRGSVLRQTGGEPVYGDFPTLRQWLERNFFALFAASVPQPLIARALLLDEGLSKHSHIVVDQTLDGESVAAYADKLVEWVIEEFWKNACTDSTQWLVFLIFRFSSLDPGNANLCAGLTQTLSSLFNNEGRKNTSPADSGAPALLLPPPDPLRAEDVKKVLERFPIDSVGRINELARQIYGALQKDGAPRLDDLHLKLGRLRRTYLETGKWELEAADNPDKPTGDVNHGRLE
jgi:hypothetical protein